MDLDESSAAVAAEGSGTDARARTNGQTAAVTERNGSATAAAAAAAVKSVRVVEPNLEPPLSPRRKIFNQARSPTVFLESPSSPISLLRQQKQELIKLYLVKKRRSSGLTAHQL